jgi:hypothetical protein
MNAAAVRLFKEAFAAEPKLTERLNSSRYNAVCAAALAAASKGKDSPTSEDGRSEHRKQALNWLRAELTGLMHLDKKEVAIQLLHHWQKDPDLAGVRDEAALAKLSESDRAAWRQLWADVAELLKRAEEAPSKGDPPPKKP